MEALFFLIAWQLHPGLLKGCPDPMEGQTKPSVLRVAFTRGMFSDMHPNDAKAAIKVWADSAARAKNINTTAEALIYEDFSALQEALNKADVELAALRIDEYLHLTLPEEPETVYVGSRRGQASESSVLLTRRSKSTLAMLEDTRLNILTHPTTGMSTLWLNSLLLENGLPEIHQFFSDIKEVGKTSNAVLPVFFGQRDACLVTQNGFEAMVELNPQIGRDLRALFISPGIVPGILFLRPGFNPPYREDIIQALDELHLDTKGQQVLMLFKMDRLIRCQDHHLLQAQILLEKYRELKRSVSEREQHRN